MKAPSNADRIPAPPERRGFSFARIRTDGRTDEGEISYTGADLRAVLRGRRAYEKIHFSILTKENNQTIIPVVYEIIQLSFMDRQQGGRWNGGRFLDRVKYLRRGRDLCDNVKLLIGARAFG